MTISPHFFAGAVAATFTTNPLVAFLLGFVLHFVLDALPHTDPGLFNDGKKGWPMWLYIYCATEFIATILVFFFLFHNRSNFVIMGIGGFGGIFPDILENFPIKSLNNLPVFKQLSFFHNYIHFNLERKDWYFGLPIQILVLGVSIWLLLKF